MGWNVRIEADSLSPKGSRLTTVVATYPRIIHAELLTHRLFSRNSNSSRAIPVAKLIERVKTNPFVPEFWGKNQKGMTAGEILTPAEQERAKAAWLVAREDAVHWATRLMDMDVHKQIVNRLLEPFSWITVIISSTSWSNFFALRCHPDAEPHLQKLAGMIRAAYLSSTPALVEYGAWHLPFTTKEERQQHKLGELKLLSAGRCARVSYLTHDGKRDPQADLDLATRLLTAKPPHSSPLEHQARPQSPWSYHDGNFVGWRQHRKDIPGEST